MEQLDLSSPVTQPSVTSYTVERLSIQRSPACIDVTAKDNNGKETAVTYNGATAQTLLGQLNKGNFTVNSLQKQVINRLIADGYLPAGSVTGTPD